MRIVRAAAAVILALASVSASAQSYPAKEVRFISNVGGAPETIIRAMFERVRQNTGAVLIYENRPGGDGAPALNGVKSAEPDGYTLGITYAGAVTLTPLMRPEFGIDPLKDFVPVTNLVAIWPAMAAREGLPVADLRDLVEMAKAKPESVRYASVSATARLWIAILEERSGAKFLAVPYKGTADATTAILGGHVDFYSDSVGAILVQKGRVKPIVYGGPTRTPVLPPNVPTMRELYQFDMISWTAVIARAGTPEPVVGWVYRELGRALKAPETTKMLDAAGLGVIGSSPEEFAKMLRAEFEGNREMLRKRPDIR